jgi:hypothetical protein
MQQIKNGSDQSLLALKRTLDDERRQHKIVMNSLEDSIIASIKAKFLSNEAAL